jgi:3-methyladenine DNA glycosylase AlkD
MRISSDLRKFTDKEKAILLQRFFKTGKGEYGEGDVFLGITVPKQRQIAKKYALLPITDLQTLLNSKIHEERLTALLILVSQYKKADKNKDEKQKEIIFNFYLKNTKNINNWDLVDLTAPNIVGNYLLDKDKSILYKLAISDNFWERRISIISTFAFIRNSDFKDAIKLSEILLKDKHDLIHKAVGWALREIGKKDLNSLIAFLDKHYKSMPRTMLRYSIEKLSETQRKYYLNKI